MSEQICKKIPRLQSGNYIVPTIKKNRIPPKKRITEHSPFNDDLPKERHKILKKLEKGNILKKQTGGMLFVPPKYQTKVAKQTFSNIDEVLNAPQKGATYLATGKYQTPSEAMNIKNPYGKFAVDAVLDPSNIAAGAFIPKGIKYLGKMREMNKLRKVFKEKEAGIEFVKNWFDHPETARRVKAMASVPDEDLINLIKETGGHTSQRAEELVQYMRQRNPVSSNEELYKSLNPNTKFDIFTTKNLNRGHLNTTLKDSPNSYGLSYPEGKYLIRRNGPHVESTTVHEAMHNATGNETTPRMNNLVKEAFGGDRAWNYARGLKDGDYFTDPAEVYARIGQLRHKFGLKPGQPVTSELSKKIFIKGMENKTPVDPEFFKLMLPGLNTKGTAKGFTDLFNKLPIQTGVAAGANQLLNNKDE